MAESSKDFIAGYISGVLGIVCGSPLDVLKVRLQTDPAPSHTHDPIPSSIHAQLRRMTEREGLSVMVRGIASPILGLAALNSILFVSYGSTLRALHPSGTESPYRMRDVYLAGGLSGLACSLVTTPTELVKCQCQVSPGPGRRVGSRDHQRSSWLVIRSILRHEGLKGLYRGNSLTIIRDIPGYAIYFGVYEGLKRLLLPTYPVSSQHQTYHLPPPIIPPTLGYMMAGGVAGIMSWLLIYPIDVIKTNAHTLPVHSTGPPQSTHLALARELCRRRGPSILFQGLGPTVLRAFPVNAVTFATYEWIMVLLS
ncbi:MAG: mitochondrial carrier domain-containing protein [Piptocephalis tieghemiana]|nr:MAG: mitochondrial carrier domain-containing protein [Piptocephalis tieghemiana]